MISAVSDFSGLDGIMSDHREESPVVTRFSHIPEFPELLPEVRAELEEIQAAMDAARAERESSAVPDVLSDAVSDEVDRIIAVPFGESVDTSVPQSSHVLPAPSDRETVTELGVPSELPPEAEEPPKIRSAVDTVRRAQFDALKSEIFGILSEDADFPAYHVKTILDLSGRISVGTPESELADIGTFLLYLSETLGVFFDREGQWNDHKHSYVSSAVRSPKTKFRLKAIRLLTPSDEHRDSEDPEILRSAKASFDRDYDRWRQKFSGLMRRNGGKSVTAFRTDFSTKPYGRTAEKCLEAGFALWKDVFLENRRIQAELTKIKGSVLLRKIRRIEKEFDFSDIERQEEIEAARRGVYRPKKRHRKTGEPSVVDSILESDWSA